MVFRVHKICLNKLFNEELNKIKSIFWAPSYHQKKHLTIPSLNYKKPNKLGPSKCPIYLRLQFLGKEATALKKNVKNTVNSTFRSVQVRIIHFTGKPLNGIYKDITTGQEKSKVIYKFKCYCNSVLYTG